MRRRGLFGAWVLALIGALGGCASPSSNPSSPQGGGLVDRALQLTGWQKPALPDAMSQLPPLPLPSNARSVTLRLHAGEVLNVDAQGRSLALVARVYKLRASDTFLQAPHEAFQQDPARHKELPFAQDVVDMREVVLTPGQRLDGIETLGPEVKAIAVVALFRAPAPQRWRFVFDTASATRTGITMGAHGCALSVAQGQPLDAAPETLRVAGVRCTG
jgi:type VI secretion system protein VasD